MKENLFLLMITKVKNEADIIEFFLRYHSNIFDKIVVIDNGSVDGTYEIVNELIREGLDIELVNEAYEEFDAYRMANQYTEKYVRETKADFVVFMDADEFLVDINDKNPRSTIQKLDKDKVHFVYWKTYLYERDCAYFNFDCSSTYRNEEEETYTKIIVSGELYLNEKMIITAGNHSFKSKNDIAISTHSDIKFLHFPIRSLNQYKKQILVNCIQMLENTKIHVQTGSHWKEMYAATNGENVDLYEKSLRYAFYNGNQIIKGSQIDLFDIKNKIKYTELQVHDLNIILLKIMEIQALKIKKMKFQSATAKRELILVFGFGEYCKSMIERLDQSKYEIVAYVDSDREKQYMSYNHTIIISPEKMRFFRFDKIIIATENYIDEIIDRIYTEFPTISESKMKHIDEIVLDGYRERIS